MTKETRDVFREFPTYQLSQSNAAKLSRLEPAKQKTAAILLVSHQIKSVDEYEPEQVEGKTPRKSKQSKEFLESVAALKDPTKGTMADSDMFLSEYRALVQEVRQQIGFYHDPYFQKAVFPLAQPEMDELESLTDSCCEMMQDFVRRVKEGKWQQPD